MEYLNLAARAAAELVAIFLFLACIAVWAKIGPEILTKLF